MASLTLNESSVMATFAESCVDIYRGWQQETAARRRSAIQDAVRTAVRAATVPEFSFFFKKMMPCQGGHMDAQNWQLAINTEKSDTHGLSKADFISFCSVLYHEARHGEQWYRCVQGVLAGELKNPWLDGVNVAPKYVASVMYMPLKVIQHAEARGTVSWNSYKTQLPVNGWFESVWGQHRVHRGHVLDHLDTMYQQYLNLPEELDAWDLQFNVEALLGPLLGGVGQHVVEEAESVQSMTRQHAKAIEQSKPAAPPNSLQAQLQHVKLKHVTLPEYSSKVNALARSHADKMAQASQSTASGGIQSTGASTRVKDLIAAQSRLQAQLGKLR